MADHVLDVAAFRAKFPAFNDAGSYPDATLQTFWTLGTEWLGASDGPLLCGPTLQTALDYMAAHLLWLSYGPMAAAGGPPGVVTQSTIDKVTIILAPPKARSEWGLWLSTTSYGAALLAFLRLKSAGGFYMGGAPVRAGFRGPVGRFGR